MEKVKEVKEEKTNKATGDKREEAVVKEKLIIAKENCTKEVQTVLMKYNCILKAQMTINDERIVSQVFIINNDIVNEK